MVREGERVAAGAPLARLVDYDRVRRVRAAEQSADSLGRAEAAARARGGADASWLAAARTAAEVRRDGLRAGAAQALLRAGESGTVLSARPEALLGRRVVAGAPLLRLGDADSLEVRIVLAAGAGLVRAGQRVHLLTNAADRRAGTVAEVGVPAGARANAGVVEARVRLAAGPAWRVGTRGDARVEVARSTVLGALVWGVRTRMRSDLLL